MALKKRWIGLLLTSGFVLSGCGTPPPPPPVMKSKAPLSSLSSKKSASPPVTYAFQLIKDGKYKEASQFVNVALQAQPKNPIFHILNGMIYEKMAETGDQSNFELAGVGYKNALNLDPSNIFAVTQLAKLKTRDKQYGDAQELFANALLIRPDDPDLLHELAAASYYAYDIKTAITAIAQAEKLKPKDPLIHRSAAMIHAAVGDFPTANKHFKAFKQAVGDDPGVAQVASRLDDWTSLYKSGRISLTPAATPPLPIPAKAPGAPEAVAPVAAIANPAEANKAAEALAMPLGGPSQGDPSDPQIIVDCYLMRVQEDTQTSKGVNLMQGLAVSLNPGTFLNYSGTSAISPSTPKFIGAASTMTTSTVGSTPATGLVPGVAPTNAMVVTVPGSSGGVGGIQNFSGKVFASGLTWGALTYSLNIAKASDERTELVSRPSLMTFLKKQSIFFAGEELVTGLSGQFGGTLVKYPIGTTMIVTPQKLDDDVVTLNISVEGSLLLQAVPPNLNNNTVQVGKTRIDTQVKMRLGDTLMLGGIYERLENNDKSGVPGLRDVPVVQYFFSTETTHSTRRSIIIMITPRSTNVVRAAVDRAMQRGGQPCLGELATRNPDWFNTIPNLVPLFQYIAKDPIIYYEFRGGDILPPSWGWEPSTVDKLGELESFLYY